METKEMLDQIASTFEEFKKANDERWESLKKSGRADVLLEEKVDKMSLALNKMNDKLSQIELRQTRPGQSSITDADKIKAEHKLAFYDWVRHGNDAGLRDLEQKALNITTGGDGGYLVPEVTDPNVAALYLKLSPMRQIANVINVSTSDYRVIVNTRGTGSGWVGEADARTETGTPTLAEVQAVMGEVYANAFATQSLLDDAFFNAEQFLTNDINEHFAKAEGTAFVTGDGTKKPKGFMNYTLSSSVDGSRTFGQLQYVATGTNGAFKTVSASVSPLDDLITLLYSLKPQHRANAVFVANALTIAAIRKFKANDGTYAWVESNVAGTPPTLLGYPVVEMPDMPDIGSGAAVLAVGDFRSGYTIVDRVGIRTLRDPFTNKPYVGFYATKRVGGMVVNSDAIKVLKLSAS